MKLPSNPACVLVQMTATTLEERPAYRRMARNSFGDVALARIASVPQSVEALLDEVPAQSPESTQVQLVHAGSVIVEQGGRQTEYAAGRLAVYDASRPFRFIYPAEFSTTIVQLPTRLLGGGAAPFEGVEPPAGERGSPAQTMLSQLLRSPALAAAGPAPQHATAISSALLEATRLLALERRGDGRRGPVRMRALRSAVIEHLHARLGDPTLSAASIAARFGVSLRTLHAAFDGGPSLGAVLRELRLDEATRLLGSTDLSVGEVAAQVGYSDVTHFIRLYRAATGTTPARWRRESGRRVTPA